MGAKQVLVGGGSGFIGKRLVSLLTAKGYDVTIISRMPGNNRITWHELESGMGISADTVAVVNVAGQNVLDPTRRWTPGFKQNVWNSRINTTATLTKAITQAEVKPAAFITISGVSAYKPNDKIYTETDQCSPYDFMSKLCAAWESAATLPGNIETRQVKIRSGVVIGREGGMIGNMYYPFKFGVGGSIGDGTHPLPWIHIIDLCNLISFSIESNQAHGLINAVAPDIITNSEFTKAFASSLRRPAIFSLPIIALNLLFNKERAILLTTGAKIHPEQALKIGFKFQYPKIRDACMEVCGKKCE